MSHQLRHIYIQASLTQRSFFTAEDSRMHHKACQYIVTNNIMP